MPTRARPGIFAFLALAALAALPAAAAQIGALDFKAATNEIDDSGIGFVHAGFAAQSPALEETTGAGACWGDADGDGDLDLYVTNSIKAGGTHTSKLYRNVGDGQFEDATAAAGVALVARAQGCAWGDYDNDGDADLYVATVVTPDSTQGNVLYRNKGGLRFEDVTASARVSGEVEDAPCDPPMQVGDAWRDRCWGTSVAWLDFDNDGDLDLYVANYVKLGQGTCISSPAPNPKNCQGQANRLYRNDADGTFTDVASAVGAAVNGNSTRGRSLGVIAADVDLDGWTDLYVANDLDSNALYLNRGGTFEDVAGARGVTNWGITLINESLPPAQQERGHRAGMGVDAQDVDGDGRPELISTHLSGQRDGFYVSNAAASWVDRADELGVGGYGWSRWGAGFVDLDNDGWRDLLVVSGDQSSAQAGVVYIYFWDAAQGKYVEAVNGNGVSFVEAGVAENAQNHRSAAFADYDDDGDMDVYIGTLQDRDGEAGRPKLVRFNYLGEGSDHLNNDWGDNHWLGVKLQGKTANRDGVGAVVKVTAGGRTQTALASSGGSYQSGNDPRLHFGLGGATTATIKVTWPAVGGSTFTQTVTVSEVDRFVTVVESRDLPPPAVRLREPTGVGHDRVTLSWTPSFAPDASKYRIYRGTTAGFALATADVREVTGRAITSYTWTGLPEATDHRFRVAVVDAAGQVGAASAEVATRTLAAPLEPVELEAPLDVTTSSVTLRWTASASAAFEAYEVHAGDAAGFEPSPATLRARIPERDATTAAVDGLPDATRHWFRVVVTGADGARSPASAAVEATTLNAPPPPVALALREGGARASNVTLQWAASEAHDFARYEVSVHPAGTPPDFTGPLSRTTTERATVTATVDGLADATAYEAVVRVVDAGGLAAESAPVAFSTGDGPPLPVALEPVGSAQVGESVVNLVWSRSTADDFARYEVEVARDAAFDAVERRIDVADRDQTGASVTGLLDGVLYRARVVVVDATGNRAPSDAVAFETRNAPPGAVAPPRPRVGPEAGQAALAWDASEAHDFLSYEVHVGAAPDFAPSAATRVATLADRNATTRALAGLADAAHARVVVLDASGLSSASASVPVPAAEAARAPHASASSPAPRVLVVDVEWPDAVAGARELLVHDARAPFAFPLASAPASARRITVADAPVGERVCVVVVARAAGFDVASRAACAAVADGTEEERRRALLVQRPAAEPGERDVALSWWTPEMVKSRVEVGRDAASLAAVDASAAVAASDGGYLHTLTVRGLDAGARHAWRVTVTAADGIEASTPVSTFSTLRDRTPPPRLDRVTATRDDAGVRVAWAASAAADARGYHVYRSVDGSRFDLAAAVLAPGLAWLDAAPPRAGDVRYRVVAVDHAGNELPPEDGVEARMLLAVERPPSSDGGGAGGEPGEPAEPTAPTAGGDGDGVTLTPVAAGEERKRTPGFGVAAVLAVIGLAVALRRK